MYVHIQPYKFKLTADAVVALSVIYGKSDRSNFLSGCTIRMSDLRTEEVGENLHKSLKLLAKHNLVAGVRQTDIGEYYVIITPLGIDYLQRINA